MQSEPQSLPTPTGVVAVLVLTIGVKEVVSIGEEHLAGSIAEGYHLGGTRRWSFMCGYDLESPNVRAWPANVDASLLVRLMLGVVVVDALVLDAKHSKPILAVQEVMKTPVEEVVSNVPKAVGSDPTPRGIGMVFAALEVIAIVIVGIITPFITGIPACSRLGCPLCG